MLLYVYRLRKVFTVLCDSIGTCATLGIWPNLIWIKNVKPFVKTGKTSFAPLTHTKVCHKTMVRSRHCSAVHREFTLRAHVSSEASSSSKRIPYPKEITDYLDQYVIGQEHAKKALAVGVYQHYKRFSHNASLNEKNSEKQERPIYVSRRSSISDYSMHDHAAKDNIILRKLIHRNNEKRTAKINFNRKSIRNLLEADKECSLDKSNIILLGPTGVGKTYLTQMLAKILDVPIAMCDCTLLTQVGYVGDDVDTVIQKLLINADGDVNAAQQGIVFLDEFDKISSSLDFESRSFRDVGGRGVQQAFLKLVEGTAVRVKLPGSNGTKVDVDTTNILFIASGAFNNLDRIVGQRLHKRNVGFGTKQDEFCYDYLRDKDETVTCKYRDNLLRQVDHADFIKFGIIPELVGRFPVLVPFGSLTIELLVRIMKEPKNSIISQAKKQFLLDNIQLHFTECALQEIARMAVQKKTGARALRSIMEKILLDPKYDLPGTTTRKLIIDENVVKGNCRYHTMEDTNVTSDSTQKSVTQIRSSNNQLVKFRGEEPTNTKSSQTN